MSSSSSERKAMFNAFNKQCKYVMREVRELLPGLSGIGMIMLVLKVSKRVNRRMPHRYFVEFIHTPFGARIGTRDITFFESDAFQVARYDALVAEMKSQWQLLDAVNRDTVWRRLADLLAASDRCTALLSGAGSVDDD